MNPPRQPASIRRSKWLTLVFPLTLFVIASIFIVLPVRHSLQQRRFEIQSKQTLLEIQRALQDFHVDEEIYPRRTPMTGAQLVHFLVEAGHLEKPPLNPWTRAPYHIEDPDQPDGITYHTDELAETYALECKALDPDTEAIAWQLDSTEHHSLE